MKIIKKNYKKFILFFVFGILAYVLFELRSDLLIIKIINPWWFLVSIFFIVIFLIVNGLMTKTILKQFSIILTINESIGLSVINALGNLITPFRGGMVSNAVYLKKRYGFNIKNFVSMISATYVIIFWVNSFIGLITCIYIKNRLKIFDLPVFLVFTGGVILLSYILLFSPKIKESKILFINKITYVLNKWQLISKNKGLIVSMALFTVLNTILIVLSNYSIFRAIGENVSIDKLIFLSVFSIFSLFISITPAGLGVKEAFTVYSGLVVGIPAAKIITLSLLDRFLNILVVLILGYPYSQMLLKKTKYISSVHD